jgi:lipid-binding SYLF domain-containing protein
MDEPRIGRRATLIGAATATLAWSAGASAQQRGRDENLQQLVDRAREVVVELRGDAKFPSLNDYLARAHGALIVPRFLKGGFILGGAGGSGVLLGRANSGSWSAPAFYTLSAASVGLQIGGEVQRLFFVIMTKQGLEEILQHEVKLGANASVAAGPIGLGYEAANSDVVVYSKGKGGYVGVTFEGANINGRESWNQRYYGRSVSTHDIVLHRKVDSEKARGLKQALAAARGARRS